MAFAKDWIDGYSRVNRLAAVVGATREWVQTVLFSHARPNQAEHDIWVQAATDGDITNWLFGLFDGGK